MSLASGSVGRQTCRSMFDKSPPITCGEEEGFVGEPLIFVQEQRRAVWKDHLHHIGVLQAENRLVKAGRYTVQGCDIRLTSADAGSLRRYLDDERELTRYGPVTCMGLHAGKIQQCTRAIRFAARNNGD